MNWERIKGNWTQARGRIRMHWGKLTDDQLNVIEGRRELLLGKLQEAYGMTTDEAERQVTEWETAEFESDPTQPVPETTAPRRAV